MKRRISSRKKREVLAIMLALSLPFSVLAQGGLFQRGENPENLRSSDAATLTNQSFGATQGGLMNQGFGATHGGITNQTFGAPIGNGLLVLLAAGTSYATIKTKKRKSNR